MSNFGKLLKERMVNHKPKITQSSLGRTVGVHRTTISDYIAGKYLPSEETFHRIHQVFPDIELYTAYFDEVEPEQPRKNKPLINNTESYNYFKAGKDNPSTSVINSITKMVDDTDKEYIKKALAFIIDYMKEAKVDKLAPRDYAMYVELFDKYSKEK